MASTNKISVTVKQKPVIRVRLNNNSQIKPNAVENQIETIDEEKLLALIDERVKALNIKPEKPPEPQQEIIHKSEIGVVTWESINFTVGYPVSLSEIKFKTPFKDERVMVKITPTFSKMTNTPYIFNVYNVTSTGFQLRMNVRNVENNGLLQALYYEAIYMGNEDN